MKPQEYLGVTITPLLSGFYEFYSHKQGRFIKADSLKLAKQLIYQEQNT